MDPSSNRPEKKAVQSVFNLTVAAVVGQVGCVTLVVLLAAIFGGLWLDSQFNTRPLFTIGLTLASIPVTLVAMLWIVRTATSRLQSKSKKETENIQEEANGGKYS